MDARSTNLPAAPPRPSSPSAFGAWADLSLRTKLLLFALALVTLPGVVFALVAFSGARAALEREVGIQLQQTAERGADALSEVLERTQSDARSWASQDVMRDLLVGDLDKRVSRLLHAVADDEPSYREVLCVDGEGHVVAASSGAWIGRSVHDWPVMDALLGGGEALIGPTTSPDFGAEVLQIGVPIRNPDPPGGRIGFLILTYDWRGVQAVLGGIRDKLANLGKRVASIVVDRDGKVIGGVSFDGEPAQRSALAAETWNGSTSPSHAVRRSPGSGGDVLVGAARVAGLRQGWSVLFIERTAEALAAVRKVRSRWILVIASILLVGLAVAVLLARQFMRPLDEVTRATAEVASHPELGLPPLPVRSRNEVGQLTESFNKMTAELKRSREEALAAAKFAFAGELAAMVAHEVRTPLSVMRSSAQMLAKPVAGGADNAELVDTIVAEVDRVERVVTGLIELARPLEQHPEPTRLADLLSRAAQFAGAEAARQGIRIACALPNGEPRALCDPEQMYQVALNLVVNALQALPAGGTITLRTFSEGSGVVGFEVGDDGPGLPREIRDRIFQPFVTGREGGTGLGLAFVERIVKAHRGTVSVRGEAGEGTVFTIRLPAEGSAESGTRP